MQQFTAALFAGFVAIAAVYGLINWCKKAATGDKAAVMGLYLLWGMPGALLFIAGLALAVNGQSAGVPVLSIGLGLSLPLLRPFRQLVASFTPMDPESPIDWSGLAVVLGMLGFLIPFALDNQETVSVANETVADLFTGVLTQLLAFVGLAYAAVGYRNYRTGEEATGRLGIQVPTPTQIAAGLVGVAVAFAAALIGGQLTIWFQPDVLDNLKSSISSATGGSSAPVIALILAIFSGFGEEVLFRGAIQPRLGIIITSVLFTAMHAQYGFTWILLGLFLIGVTFGVLRSRYGTMAAVVAHVVYNILVVVLQSWIL